VDAGYPLWGGYRPFEATPSYRTWCDNPEQPFEGPERQNLFDDVVYWSRRMTHDLEAVDSDPAILALPMCKLVIADWKTMLKHMTTMLGKIEWEFENPHWGTPSDNAKLIKKLSPWRRNVGYYQAWIAEAIARLSPPQTGLGSLHTDFGSVQQEMKNIQLRIERIQVMATNAINAEEGRLTANQNSQFARLTLLATIFLPLNFTSSFLSISPDFFLATNTIWLFFAIGVTMTLTVLLIVDLTRPEGKGVVRALLQAVFASKKASPAVSSEQQASPSASRRTGTVPWKIAMQGPSTLNYDRRDL